jgi:tetratricopeptide (TPR) repeat protein
MKRTTSQGLTLTAIPDGVGVQAARQCGFGFVILKKYQFASALERFDAVLGEEPDCVAALFGRALALRGMGHARLALAAVRRAESLVIGQNATLLLLRAELLMMQRQYQQAGEACQAALGINPWLLRGQWLRLRLLGANGWRLTQLPGTPGGNNAA